MIKIISGGQTGIDRMALELAKELGFETGGFATKGYLTENGTDLSLKDFGLIEMKTSNYPNRTKENIKLAHGTILFGNLQSPGSTLVRNYCLNNFHPIIENPKPGQIIDFINNLKQICKNNNVILNIAGNRLSKISKGDLAIYERILYLALNGYKNLNE